MKKNWAGEISFRYVFIYLINDLTPSAGDQITFSVYLQLKAQVRHTGELCI